MNLMNSLCHKQNSFPHIYPRFPQMRMSKSVLLSECRLSSCEYSVCTPLQSLQGSDSSYGSRGHRKCKGAFRG